MAGPRIIAGIALATTASACASSPPETLAPAYPLMDSECSEYSALGADAEALPHDVTLYTFQDDSYVWFCAALPPESYGTVDIEIDAPGLKTHMNLHVSAQVGEWPVNDPEAAPQSPESDKWWKMSGWSSIAVHMNGYEEDENGQRRARFIPSAGRELQLDKNHFGRGAWELKFTFNSIRKADGERTTVSFPEDETEVVLIVAH